MQALQLSMWGSQEEGNQQVLLPESEVGAMECVHHWDLGNPLNGTVHGRCRKCGAERDFPSHVPSLFPVRTNRKKPEQTRNSGREVRPGVFGMRMEPLA